MARFAVEKDKLLSPVIIEHEVLSIRPRCSSDVTRTSQIQAFILFVSAIHSFLSDVGYPNLTSHPTVEKKIKKNQECDG